MRAARKAVLVLIAVAMTTGCQKPTDPDDVTNYNDVIDASVSPNPAMADVSRGKTYRVVRGNNQPDEILEYDWQTTFAVTISFNNKATRDNVDVDFPVKLSAAALVVKQASGGIVTPPTGGETEHYESVTLQASGNQFAAVGSSVTMTFQVWYDLPSLRREALVNVNLSFVDDSGTSFTRTVDVQVAP